MSTSRIQIEDWVNKTFQACGLYEAPRHLIIHYSEMIEKAFLTFEQAQREIMFITQFDKVRTSSSGQVHTPSSSGPTTPTKHNADLGPAPSGLTAEMFSQKEGESLDQAADRILHEENQKRTLNKTTNTPSREEQLHEYIDQLFIRCTGKKGHPSDTNFLLSNLQNNSYTLNQAELYVVNCKEAKQYREKMQKQKVETEKKQHEQFKQYVTELYRVYLKNNAPDQNDIDDYVKEIEEGRKLQDVEDEFKLMQISPPKQK